ncbi:MAG TPA: SDR family NAD(P)-dependent oxidoreductase, partial [Symbiobacteriaceae bacterium]|nr:SDR family NAD(P)-dependent oxidoreductase [Symbiobacteriaceae bacterium]
MEPIAVIGMGCRFPGAHNVREFWRLLTDGVDAVSEVPAGRWDAAACSSRWGGFLDEIDQFDYRFFGISPREAERMDPQQRLLLEVAWEALEDGGQVPERLAGRNVGVFVGVMNPDYGHMQVSDLEQINAYTGTGGALCITANRLSYFLDLRGPSMAVDTACSSSLVAVHLACQSLWSGDSYPLAIAGGVNLILSPAGMLFFGKAGVMAPDGRCKPFDAAANGITRGEGAGMVVLKPLSLALADGDPIYAVIRASAINQDGRTNGLMAPNRFSQEAMLREAYRRAGLSPGCVQYVEAHGTGTLLGDPIEAAALGAVLAEGRTPGDRCLLGSVKSNLGHLESAAGVAGLIKTALMLKHRQIVPSLHFHQPNPYIRFDALPLRVAAEAEPWPDAGRPALAGVSSFGFGGANAHVVLEEAPAHGAAHGTEQVRPYVLPLSAQGPEALKALARAVADQLLASGGAGLPDLCYTAGVRRTHHDHRLAVVGRTAAELASALAAYADGQAAKNLYSGRRMGGRRPRVGFVFPGQGPQWWAMGRQLFETESVFRQSLERTDALLKQQAGWSLVDELLASEERSRLGETVVAQPVLFALQVALADLWRSLGINPDAVVGHSLGEVAAAHVAGVLSLADAVRLVAHRGRIMQQATGLGKMAAIELPPEQVQQALSAYGGRLDLAAVNSPGATVASGDAAALAELKAQLESAGVTVRDLPVNYAFHSHILEPFKAELSEELAGLTPGAATVRIVSTLTGDAAEGPEFGPDYWARQMREPVAFSSAVDRLIAEGVTAFVELSPHPTLLGNVARCLQHRAKEGITLPSLRRGEDEQAVVLGTLGALYAAGFPVDWTHLTPSGNHTDLPFYPWQRERCWLPEPPAKDSWIAPAAKGHPLLGARVPLAAEQQRPVWQGRLSVRTQPFLGDHRIQGAVVVPGTAYLEMAMAAGEELLGKGPLVLTDLQTDKALFLTEEGSRTVQVSCTLNGAFQIHSRQGEGWVLHASGRMKPGSVAAPVAALDQVRAACHAELTGEEYYRILPRKGFEYGPWFQSIRQVWRRDGEALARLQAPAELAGDLERYRFHPALLDACGHLLMAAEPDEAAGGTVYLPVGADEVRIYGGPAAQLWSHAVRREAPADTLAGDVRVIGEDGTVLAEILGLRFRRLTAGVSETETTDLLSYTLEWERYHPAESGVVRPSERWLLVADQAGVAAALAHKLAGAACRVVSAAEAPGAAAWATRVVCLQTLSAVGETDPTFDGAALLAGLADLIGAMEQGRLWLVTRGAQCVTPGEPTVPLQTAVWGFGRTVAGERPDLWGGLIDLDPTATAEAAADQLWQALAAAGDEDQIAIRQGECYAARLDSHELRPAQGLRWRTDGAYLITGGLGDLGLAVARWMVNQGARRLILLGRTPLPPRTEWVLEDPRVRAIRELEAMGAAIHTAPVDVADAWALGQFLETYRAEQWPPIRGVVHAAGVADVRPLETTDSAALDAVMRAKVGGAWNLHHELMGEPLDFFVLFSSMSAVISSPRMAGYAAANAFMDGLAHMRRAAGLPALSVNWGPWTEVGMAARRARGAGGEGLGAVTPAQALHALEQCLSADVAQAVIMRVRWQRWREVFPEAVGAPLLKRLVTAQPAVVAEAAPTLHTLDAAGRRAYLEQFLREQVARVVKLSAAAVDPQASLNTLGLDSLMALELKNRTETQLGLPIRMVTLLQGPSIAELAAQLADAASAQAQAAPALQPAPAAAQETAYPLSHGQESLWLLNRMAPESSAYHVSFAVRIASPVDVAALSRALTTAAGRHAPLRSTFVAEGGQVLQTVHPTADLQVTEVEAAGWSEEQLRERMAQDYARPFDLGAGPLLRTVLYRRAEADCVL